MNSGIYIRVDKENVLLEQLDDYERLEWLNALDNDGLKRTINILCNTLLFIQAKYLYKDSDVDE